MKEYTAIFVLTAAEENPHMEMSLTVLINRIIEVATGHANPWGVGYDYLVKQHQAWVLSRITVETTRRPRINERYSITTWIEGYNRHFSERNMCIMAENGEVLGYVRTIWMVIDSINRTLVDITKLQYIRENISDRPCPIAKQGAMRAVADGISRDYRFQYTDLDFNQHVNTVRYVELLMNQCDISHWINRRLARFEIAFAKECTYNQEVRLALCDTDGDIRIDILDAATAAAHCKAHFFFAEK